jgi:hypothetical protein
MWRTIAGLQDQTVKPAGKRNPTLRDGLQISSGNGRLEVNGFCELCQGFICSLARTTLVETLSCRSKTSCSSPSNFCAPVAASLSWPVILTGGPVLLTRRKEHGITKRCGLDAKNTTGRLHARGLFSALRCARTRTDRWGPASRDHEEPPASRGENCSGRTRRSSSLVLARDEQP